MHRCAWPPQRLKKRHEPPHRLARRLEWSLSLQSVHHQIRQKMSHFHVPALDFVPLWSYCR